MKLREKLKLPAIILACLVGIGGILGYFVKISVYIELPKMHLALADEYYKTKEDVVDLKNMWEVQRRANELNEKWQRQQQPTYQEPPRRCWDLWEDGYEYEVDCLSGNWL